MAFPIFTKVSLNISIKGFPVGEIMNCHFWVNGTLRMDEANEKLNDLDFNEVFDGKYFYHSHVITALTTTVIVPESDNISDLIVDNVEKKPLNPIDLKDINLTNISDAEIDAFKKAFMTESFKRRYKMSDGEYEFFKSYKDKSISIDAIKAIYKANKGYTTHVPTRNMNVSIPLGDVYKEKKQKIREKLGL